MSDTKASVVSTADTESPRVPFHARHKAKLQHHWSLWLNGPHITACAIAIAFLVVGGLTFNSTWAQVRVAGLTVTPRTTASQLSAAIDRKARTYKLQVQRVDGKREYYGLMETGMRIDAKASADLAVRAKHSGAWWERLQWWEKQNIALVTASDQIRLDGFMKQTVAQTQTPYMNAIITIEDGVPVIHKSQVGSSLAVKNGRQALHDRIAHLNAQPLVQQKLHLQPRITEADLEDDRKDVADILDNAFSFTIGGDAVTAEPADIGKWLELTPDEKKKDVAVTINESAIDSYVDSLAVPYAKTSHASVVVDMPDGTSSLLFQGRGGGGVANKGQVSRELAQSVKTDKGADFNLELDYDTTPVIHAAAADRWLLVDVTSKRMYAMERNQIAQTFLVSAGAPATPTVTGKFNIYAKYTTQDMRGANADGSNYFQPNVQWINYFYRDYAVHGNYWRPTSYFGNINSSHGCVGITNEQAEWIYNWTTIGTPVVVYG